MAGPVLLQGQPEGPLFNLKTRILDPTKRSIHRTGTPGCTPALQPERTSGLSWLLSPRMPWRARGYEQSSVHRGGSVCCVVSFRTREILSHLGRKETQAESVWLCGRRSRSHAQERKQTGCCLKRRDHRMMPESLSPGACDPPVPGALERRGQVKMNILAPLRVEDSSRHSKLESSHNPTMTRLDGHAGTAELPTHSGLHNGRSLGRTARLLSLPRALLILVPRPHDCVVSQDPIPVLGPRQEVAQQHRDVADWEADLRLFKPKDKPHSVSPVAWDARDAPLFPDQVRALERSAKRSLPTDTHDPGYNPHRLARRAYPPCYPVLGASRRHLGWCQSPR
jgi:hypothetical protein